MHSVKSCLKNMYCFLLLYREKEKNWEREQNTGLNNVKDIKYSPELSNYERALRRRKKKKQTVQDIINSVLFSQRDRIWLRSPKRSRKKISGSCHAASCVCCAVTPVYHYSLKYIFVLIIFLKSDAELTVWINHGNQCFNSSIQPTSSRPAALGCLTVVVEAYACVTGGGGWGVEAESLWKTPTKETQYQPSDACNDLNAPLY